MAAAGEDWRNGKSLLECNRYMLDRQLHCDVTFNVGTTLIGAHKTILISRSKEFERMLTGPGVSVNFSVNDVKPEIFRKMLSFIYCESVDILDTDAADLLTCARKYKIKGLEDLCAHKLKTGVSIESVCIVLNHAADNQLKEKCFEFIYKFPNDVIQTDGFLDLKQEYLKVLIESDSFNVKEEKIFETIIKWSEKECTRQNVDVNLRNQNRFLEEIVKLVRFGLMNRKYVKEKCKAFLTSDVYVDVMEEIAELGDTTGYIKKKRGLVATPDDSNSVSSTLTSNSTSSSNSSSSARVFDRGNNTGPGFGLTPGSLRPNHVPPTSTFSAILRLNSSGNSHVLPPRANPSETDGIPEQTNVIRSVEVVPRFSMDHRERARLGYFIERDQRVVVERFEATQSGKAYTRDNKDGISFIASQNLKLHGILIYGSHQRPGQYKIEMEIFKDTGNRGSDLERVHAVRTSMDTDGATKVYELVITPAVNITSNKVYTIRALFKGQASYYGVKGSGTVLKDGLQINFVTDTTCLNLTSTDIGQFPGFIFEKV